MRFWAAAAVLVATTSVAADPLPESAYDYKKPNDSGVLFEVGGGWQRIHPAGITYRAQYVRFAPQVSLNRFLYLGAAFQVGHIYSSTGMAEGVYIPPASDYVDESSGTIVAPQVLIGSRGLISIFSGAVEVAPTYRMTSASADYLYLVTTNYTTTIELHARADIWPEPHFSVGVMAGMDTSSFQDFQIGLQAAFHFEPYDAMQH